MLKGIDEPGLIVGHRGAASLAPENTLTSARKALSAGADMWELDVALSADDVPFLIHDDLLRRTSDAQEIFPDRPPWRPDQFTWEEVRGLDFGSWYAATDPFGQIAQGAVSPEEAKAFRGLRAPSLRDALAFTREKNWRVNVEIKDLSDAPGHGRVVRLVVEQILDLGMQDSVLISSFHHPYLLEVKTICPDLATGALVDKRHPDPDGLLKELKAQTFHPKASLYPPAEIGRLQAAGVRVLIWTVNQAGQAVEFFKAGVTGVISDFPQRLAGPGRAGSKNQPRRHPAVSAGR